MQRWSWAAALVVLACAGHALAQPVGASQPSAATDANRELTIPRVAKLRVGYAGSPPFVIGGEEPQGLSVEIWKDVALQANLAYELVPSSTVGELLGDLRAGEVDAAIGPISITAARARQVDFTQPYFEAPLSILANASGEGPWARVAPFLSGAFLTGLGVLLSVLLIVGLLLWSVERRKNPDQFPERPLPGIGNGIWFALVTMTTVGYGDRVPVTLAGRIVAGVWMVIALLTASSLTAGIATALTLSSLDPLVVERAEDLSGRSVAVVRDTTGARFAREHGARVLDASDIDAAIALLADDEVEAVVFDRPALQYYLAQHPELDARLSPRSYEPLGYGFAVRRDDKLRQQLNVALLEVVESGRLKTTERRWLGGAE